MATAVDETGVVSQLTALAATDDAGNRARIHTMPVLVAYFESNKQTVVSQVSVLAAYSYYSRQVVVSGMPVLAAYDSDVQVVPRITQQAILAAYGTGVPSKDRSRAWIFDFDGHRFYVLDLGEEGTWLFDFTTRQWSRFDTVGYEGLWNARLGVYWAAKRATVVSDRVNSYLHLIEPTQALDESWRPIEYEVTGGLAARDRPYYSQDSFRLVASVGHLADPLGTTINFSFSDDNGNTWTTMESVVLTPDDYDQEIAWTSLGSFHSPGRIFKVTDIGGLLRIDSATAEVEGLNDGIQG